MANEGLLGAVDWVGYPVGEGTAPPPPPPPVGLFPFDFVGYSVGVPRSTVRAGRGGGVGGKRIAPLFVQLELERSVLDNAKLVHTQKVLQRQHQEQLFQQRVRYIEQRRERQQIEMAVYSCLLAEI